MLDIELGRRMRVIPRTITVGTSSIRVVTRDPFRVGLIFAGTDSNFVWLMPINAAAVGQGIVVGANVGFEQFLIKDHGDLVTQDWFGRSDASTNVLTIFEWFLPEGDIH